MLVFLSGSFCAQKISARKLRKHQQKVAASKKNSTVILSLDTIFNKGVPYAILKEEKRLPYNNYFLLSLDKKPLIDIESRVGVDQDRKLYYAFIFLETERVAEPEKYITFRIEKEIVENNLVSEGAIDPFGEYRFLKKYPRRFSNPGIARYIADDSVPGADIYVPVRRDRDKQLYVREGSIQQDLKLIGRYKLIGSAFRFYLPSGVMVAEASAKEGNSSSWQLQSLKDQKTWAVAIGEENALEKLIRFLVEHAYL